MADVLHVGMLPRRCPGVDRVENRRVGKGRDGDRSREEGRCTAKSAGSACWLALAFGLRFPKPYLPLTRPHGRCVVQSGPGRPVVQWSNGQWSSSPMVECWHFSHAAMKRDFGGF